MRYMTLATIIAGISGFVVIIVAAWAFGDNTAKAEEFTAYWGLFFAGTGVLTGLMQETTRTVATPSQVENRARPMVVGIWIALAIAVVMATTGWWWAPQIISEHRLPGIFLLSLGLGSYTIQAVVGGILSGKKLWSRYALLITLDTGSRMVLAIIAWLLGWQLLAFMVITVMGAVSWVIILATRPGIDVYADIDTRRFVRRALTSMAASGATAVLIVGFPTIVKFVHSEPSTVPAAAIIYAVTLTRAPLLVPLQQFQSTLIVRFVHGSPVRTPLLIVWVCGILGSITAYALGPWLMVTILGSAYAIPAWLLGALTIGATCTASLMITSAAALAREQHGTYLLGWVVATLIAVIVLATNLPLEIASCAALTLGPLSGLGVQLCGVGDRKQEKSTV
ncbi:hypothetical membrane protein [Corynebacterium kutscheri]|uniref:Membrane protein involved in the export of O-antigen and teichoic acid n=1 Tax=Corynebacterium kutscheri TaxID=35755 RepID=A0A0F6R0J2_9CORY|nr:hypothetical protein [Corynebacterium kutscheri]AKE40453.1 hypothetical protein UL82_01105 [Corynebacterium kutscheri]VEH10846.1 hypothetical membrane protein [Corynebacterium kutscheri]VEH80677.1 hypothetical membrane protein [Corynebacterium kutscheri]